MDQDVQKKKARTQFWHQQLRIWIPKMTHIVHARTWLELTPLVKEMARFMPELNRYPELRAHFTRELMMLRQLHMLARQGVVAYQQELEHQLDYMGRNRAGLWAYEESALWG